MNKQTSILIACFFCFGFISAQDLFVFDELGSPIKGVLVSDTSTGIESYTDQRGGVSLLYFPEDAKLQLSHSLFITREFTKRDLERLDFKVTLLFDSETIGEVILSTRIDDENIKESAERRIVLHTKEIDRLNTQTTAELLEKRAGINVQKSQMGGGSPVIRGFEANRVLLMVDGVRLNNAIYRGGHLQNIITIDNASLEQVDIIFGPSNSQYGSDALGGVINLQTKSPKFTDKPMVVSNYRARYATANQGMSAHYDVQHTGKKHALFTSVSRSLYGDLRMGLRRTHGYSDWGKVFHYVENGVQRENPNPNLQKNTGYSQVDFMQKIILKINPKYKLTGNFQYSNSSDIPRFDKLNDYNNIIESTELKYHTWNYGPQKRVLSSIQIDHSSKSRIMDSAQVIFGYQDVYESRHVQKMNTEERVDRNENVDIYSININCRKNKLQYGLEYYYNAVDSKAFLTDDRDENRPYPQTRYPNGGSSMSSLSGYLSYSRTFSEQIRLNSGLRFTQNQLDGLFHSVPNIWELPFERISYNYQALTGNLSLSYHPNDSWKIASIASTGFHAPNIDDTGKLFYKGSILTIPNFELNPEYAKTIEINITKNINNSILINANGYYTLIENAIMKVDTDLDFQINQDEFFTQAKTNKNTGEAEIYGLTASASLRIASNYTLETDYTYIKGRNTYQNRPFTHIPPSFGKTAFYADFDDWRASFFILYNGRKSIDEYDLESGTDNEQESPIEWVLSEEGNLIPEFQGTPAWMTLNMNFMYRFSDLFTVQIALENMLDEHYKTFSSGLSAPGRNFVITLHSKF